MKWLIAFISFFITFAGGAKELFPNISFGVEEEKRATHQTGQRDIPLALEETESSCSSCTLSDLLKQPSLFFKSLREYDTEPQEYQNHQLSIKLFGAYSSDLKKPGDYILTLGVRKRDSYSEDKAYINAGWIDIIRKSAPLSYRMKLRVQDSVPEDTKDKNLLWSGSAVYRIAQINSHDVFLKGGVGSDSVSSRQDPLFVHQSFVVPNKDPDNPSQNPKYLTYEMGVRIEKDKDVFLDVSAFETNVTDSIGQNVGHVKSSVPEQDVQGVEVRAGFLLDRWEGGAQYIWTHSDDEDWFEDSQFVQHLGSVRLGYSPTSKLVFGTVWTHRGEDLFDSTRSVAILDIYSFYDMSKNTRLGMVLKNVADEPYEYRNFRYERESINPDRTLWLRLEFHD